MKQNGIKLVRVLEASGKGEWGRAVRYRKTPWRRIFAIEREHKATSARCAGGLLC